MSDTRTRNRFAPGHLCRCGQRYDLHEARPGFGLRKGKPQLLHCPGKNYWTRINKLGEEKRQYYFVGVNGRGLPGGGPWVILPECTAPSHNTRRSTECASDPCICPRAKELAQLKSRERLLAMNALTKVTLLMPREHEVRTPDLSAGMCSDPYFRPIVDGGFSTEGTASGQEARYQAKKLCFRCPVRAACAEYVLAAERPAGSWGGVWGGMDPWERQREREEDA